MFRAEDVAGHELLFEWFCQLVFIEGLSKAGLTGQARGCGPGFHPEKTWRAPSWRGTVVPEKVLSQNSVLAVWKPLSPCRTEGFLRLL